MNPPVHSGTVMSFLHEDGTWSLVVHDDAPNDPCSDRDMATVICPVDTRNRVVPSHRDVDTRDALIAAVGEWGRRLDGHRLITRYLKIFWGAVVVMRQSDGEGHDYIGVITKDEITTGGITHPYSMVTDDLDEYIDYATGNVFGVIRYNTEREKTDSCWGYRGYPSHTALVTAVVDSPVHTAYEPR